MSEDATPETTETSLGEPGDEPPTAPPSSTCSVRSRTASSRAFSGWPRTPTSHLAAPRPRWPCWPSRARALLGPHRAPPVLGVDAGPAMEPFVAAVDAFHERTTPRPGSRAWSRRTSVTGIARDFYREISRYLDGDTHELVPSVLEDAGHAEFVVPSCARRSPRSRVSGRLALWARRLSARPSLRRSGSASSVTGSRHSSSVRRAAPVPTCRPREHVRATHRRALPPDVVPRPVGLSARMAPARICRRPEHGRDVWADGDDLCSSPSTRSGSSTIVPDERIHAHAARREPSWRRRYVTMRRRRSDHVVPTKTCRLPGRMSRPRAHDAAGDDGCR